MKIIKKITLIFIGILLSLIFLEIGLQTVSYTNKFIKNYKTNKQLKNQDSLTILCLGESTTDNTWPPLLQEILNRKSKNKKFNVIDEGKAGCNTNDIINIVSEAIAKEKNIDIIISMMGINDHDKNVVTIRKTKFKILKLFYLIKKHIVSNLFAQKQNICKEEDFNNVINIANKYIYEKKFEDSINLLENIIDNNLSKKQLETKYDFLITAYDNYVDQTRDFEHIFPKLKKYILDFRNNNKSFHLGLYLKILIFEKNINGIYDLFSFKDEQQFIKFINDNFDPIMMNTNEFRILGMYNLVKKIETAIYNSISDNSNLDAQTRKIGYMALNYFIEKEYTKANIFFDLQTNILLKNISKKTIKNYVKLYKICENNNIKLIAMQYPVRNIKPLKQMLKTCEGTTFISNEENFKQVLKTHKVEDIFNDRFAGDFGHCTNLGNTLIAENVAETILKLYN